MALTLKENYVYVSVHSMFNSGESVLPFYHQGPEALTQVSQQAPVPAGPSRQHTLVQSMVFLKIYFIGLETSLSG